MVKVIIFDFDGVLVESVDIKTKAFIKLFEYNGKEIIEKVVDYHLKNLGVSRFDKFKYIYREILNNQLTEELFESLCQRFSQLVMDEVVKAPYVKGAKEFLDRWAEIYQCYIASATPQEEIEEIIRRRKMSHYFKGIYGSPKKKVDIVRDILATYRLRHEIASSHSVLSPQSFVYVGDALSDYTSAKDNSIKFIARINKNESIFLNTNCLKIKDLMNLDNIIETL